MGMTIALTMRSVTLETTPVRGSPAHPLVATTAIAKPSATMRVNANAMTAITMTQPLSLLAVIIFCFALRMPSTVETSTLLQVCLYKFGLITIHGLKTQKNC